MNAEKDRAFGLVTSREELVLRRRLLFRLLKDFDFARPRLPGELITSPLARDQAAFGRAAVAEPSAAR